MSEINELVDKHINEKKKPMRQKSIKKKKEDKTVVDKIRKPMAPPSKSMGDKSKYDRKQKHKKSY